MCLLPAAHDTYAHPKALKSALFEYGATKDKQLEQPSSRPGSVTPACAPRPCLQALQMLCGQTPPPMAWPASEHGQRRRRWRRGGCAGAERKRCCQRGAITGS